MEVRGFKNGKYSRKGGGGGDEGRGFFFFCFFFINKNASCLKKNCFDFFDDSVLSADLSSFCRYVGY